LVSRAARNAGVEGLDEPFIGPTAIAFVRGEPLLTAKALRDFAREYAALVIKGGYLDGRPLIVVEVTQIADLGGSRKVSLT
jgi:large subunit ribosomal protein L10